MKKIRLVFDMDGTIADLYGRNGWLEMLKAESHTFHDLEPLGEYDKILEALETLKAIAPQTEIVVCSWLPMNASGDYERLCTLDKLHWLRVNGFSKVSDGAFIVPYGTDKTIAVTEEENTIQILFDDNGEVRAQFTEATNCQAFDENQILPVLHMLIEICS